MTAPDGPGPDGETTLKLLGMCIDKRVVVGAVSTAGLVWWLAPGAFAAALPLLLLAVCPLSMLLMMKAMNMGGEEESATASPAAPPATGLVPTPLDILEDRFARGEIDQEEFEARRRSLRR